MRIILMIVDNSPILNPQYYLKKTYFFKITNCNIIEFLNC